MAPGFTLKGLSLSPARPNLPLQIPSTNVTPLSSPGRSPINTQPSPSAGYFSRADATSAGKTKGISRDDAFKAVKHFEEVLTAWNEYRIALNQAGKAGRKLGAALRDLGGDNHRTSVAGK